MSSLADPKDGKRLVDPDALRRARARGNECVACGAPPGSVHHVVQRGSPHFGDDVIENLVLLCGTGSSGCHGAWHGSPYIAYLRPVVAGLDHRERRDRDWVAERIGRHISVDRPDTLRYVIGKLGIAPAIVFLWQEYRIEEHAVLRAHEGRLAS